MRAAGVERGWLEDARQAYANAGLLLPRKDVIACGYRLLERGDTDAAYDVFTDIRYVKGCVACGKAFLRDGGLFMGQAAFAQANKPAPPELLVACGVRSLGWGNFDSARETFAAAGRPITREMWIEAGDRLMHRNMEDMADIAYAEAERLAVAEK